MSKNGYCEAISDVNHLVFVNGVLNSYKGFKIYGKDAVGTLTAFFEV